MSTTTDQPVPLAREPQADFDTGAHIGRYLIVERVGSGAMGVVYGAYDPELDRKIALKVLKGSEVGQQDAARARLWREAKATARLAHPNVIAVHDVGIFNGQVFLAMEFLGGGTLGSWLGARPRHWREVLDVFVAAGRGLAAAHAAGLVHRDFKPDNVLLDKEGRPRVVDFGLARDAASASDDGGGADAISTAAAAPAPATETASNHLETLTRTGTIMGTPAYMAPEQIAGDATDERTDQFSFCVALYEALYGERPFRGDSLLRLLHNVSEGALEPTPEDREVPAWIRRAVLRGLEADPAQRWPSMAPLIAALQDDPAARHVPAGRIVAEADSALGAFVSYVVTATDAVSGPVPLGGTPSAPPGQPVLFPLGETTLVTCTVTDSSNNRTQASFTVHVAVSWSNLLAPINPLGVTTFLRQLPISVKFALTGSSAGITNLGARLFVAPVNAAGNVGAEGPAVNAAPALDNLFRYVPLAGQYLLSMSTAGMQAGTWQLRVDLGDGVPHTARIRLL